MFLLILLMEFVEQLKLPNAYVEYLGLNHLAWITRD